MQNNSTLEDIIKLFNTYQLLREELAQAEQLYKETTEDVKSSAEMIKKVGDKHEEAQWLFEQCGGKWQQRVRKNTAQVLDFLQMWAGQGGKIDNEMLNNKAFAIIFEHLLKAQEPLANIVTAKCESEAPNKSKFERIFETFNSYQYFKKCLGEARREYEIEKNKAEKKPNTAYYKEKIKNLEQDYEHDKARYEDRMQKCAGLMMVQLGSATHLLLSILKGFTGKDGLISKDIQEKLMTNKVFVMTCQGWLKQVDEEVNKVSSMIKNEEELKDIIELFNRFQPQKEQLKKAEEGNQEALLLEQAKKQAQQQYWKEYELYKNGMQNSYDEQYRQGGEEGAKKFLKETLGVERLEETQWWEDLKARENRLKATPSNAKINEYKEKYEDCEWLANIFEAQWQEKTEKNSSELLTFLKPYADEYGFISEITQKMLVHRIFNSKMEKGEESRRQSFTDMVSVRGEQKQHQLL